MRVKKMSGKNRFLAGLLAVVMIVSMLPASVFAATGETTYVLAGSDFQPTDGNNTTGVNLVNGILDKIDDKYTTMDGFLFAGDYDYNYAASQSGKEALQGAVQAVYGTGMDEVYIEGNHDDPDHGSNPDLIAAGVFNQSGNNDTDKYGVFVINHSDYMWYNSDEAAIKNIAASLETYLNAKRNASYTKPIFVVSHLPLHYCMRTQVGGGDGKYANYIFDVLNEAGEAGLNIIFLFGHNHSHGWDDPYGGAAIFLKSGDKINIAQNSTTNYNVETLNFTYMNAGYVSYYRHVNEGAETDLSMTTFAITDTDVTIERYTADGLHDLKSAGVANKHAADGSSVDGSCSTKHGGNETYSPDTSVVSSSYTLTLNTEITPAGTEVEAPDSGTTTTQRTYTRVTSLDQLVSGDQYLLIENGDTDYFMLPETTSNSAGDRVGYAIESTTVAGGDTITGDYSAKEWTMTGSGTSWILSTTAGSAYMEYQSSSRAYGRISSSDSSTFTIGGSANAYTFSTTTNNYTYVFDHSSAGLINGYVKTPDTLFYIYRMTNEGSSGSTVDTSGGNWITITEPTEAGTKYVYELDTNGVDTGVEYLIVANSYEKALSAAASSNNAVDIEISGNYAYADSDTYGWTFSNVNYGSGYYIRLNGSTYLDGSEGSLTSRNYSSWSVSNNGDGSYDITSGWRTTYNLRWSNTNGVFQASSSNEGPVRLYKYVRTETTQAADGLYGKISGNLTYNVDIGTSEEDALAIVKEGIDILYVYANSDPSEDNTGDVFPDDGEGMTWTLDESYDGTTPGEYAVTIAYNGITLGVVKVIVPAVAIKGYTVEPAEGTVNKGASQAAQTGALIYVQLEDGKYYTVPVTVSMLTKADGSAVSTGEEGTFENLTLTYNGVVITNNFTLNVVAKTGNNYPEYPNEGAVKVSKTATGIDFQSSGIAQVEVSASGVPMKKGADVIVMLDLSSSMNDNKVTVNGVEKTRLQVLRESLTVLLTQLQANGEDDQPMDIRIAVADFNRYYTNSSSPYYINTNDHLKNGSIRTNANGENKVYTGEGTMNADAFVDVHDIASNAFETTTTTNQYYLGYASGTNYDYAFDAVYQLGEAIMTANADAGEERNLFVVFMSDGAPFQFNYFSSQSGAGDDDSNPEEVNEAAALWNNWLQGTLTDDMKDAGARNDYYNEEGKHWMAEAIKGDPASTYPVIRKNNAADTDGDTWVNVNGLGATMFSIGFCLAKDKEITVDSMDSVIQKIASEQTGTTEFYYRADSADDLNDAFTSIGKEIAYAASNARFVDQMGDNFNLQLKTSSYTVVENGAEVEKSLTPTIEILSYDIYTRQDYLNGTITEDKIGDRKGTYTILETVTFNADGTEAYSDQINDGQTNILADGTQDGYVKGVIYAKTFLYNTNVQDVAVDGVNIPTGVKTDGTTTGSTNILPSETFYWKLGTVQTSELAMRYYVYLEGSMEGTKEAGSYATNEFATLYYDNYLGNPCYKDTVSPTIAWKEASVSYAFYLVNKAGEIIVNQTTGQTGSFANKIAVTNPVVYDEILLNNQDQIRAISVTDVSNTVLPDGYALYDSAAEYFISIRSNGTGYWEITYANNDENTSNDDSDIVQSTYVTQFHPTNASAYSNEVKNDIVGNDYTHTVVWFAVVWEPQALPDAVVIDYGLPVDISVLTNDMFGENGKLVGVGPYSESLHLNGYDTAMADGFGTSYTGTYGTATANAETGKVRYELNKSNGMQMQTYEKFAYAVDYAGIGSSKEGMGYYYDTITVIPATTIYYEDDFLTLSGSKTEWEDVGTAIEDATQDEDRPGQYSLTDANNIYGYDAVNLGMSTYSLGTAKKVHVDAESYATAEFTFYGTGFDVVSMTSNTSGVIAVQVKDADGNSVAAKVVNTYYGYTSALYNVTYTYTDGEWVRVVGELAAEGATASTVVYPASPEEGDTCTAIEQIWVATPDTEAALYQVPVLQIEGLTYGKYTATITATYAAPLDKTTADGYDLYLDAIRIYDPANDGAADSDTVIENAYKADGESWPSYIELRNKLIAANSFDDVANDALTTDMEGLVFIDGDASVGDAQMADYVNYGPNNEVYLAPGQRVAFIMGNVTDNVANIHIGIKLASGDTGTYTITNIAQTTNAETGVEAGAYYNARTSTINTATDMYYDITGYKNDIIVISNTGDRYGTTGIISLTNIKSTYTSDPNGAVVASLDEETDSNETTVYMTAEAAALTLRTLNTVVEEETPEVEQTPEQSVPEVEQPKPGKPEKPDKQEQVKPEKPDNPNKGPQNNSGNNKNNKNNGKNNNRSNGRYF